MINRPDKLLKIRPDIKKIEGFDKMNILESFQNQTLRPILKFQNPIILEVYRNYLGTRKGVFYKLSNEGRLDYIKKTCLLYTSPSPRDGLLSRMPSSA